MLSLAEAARAREERILAEELDKRINLLLEGAHVQTPDPHFARVTADPRKMGYLRFLLRHYAKSAHPWTQCVAPDTPIRTSKGTRRIDQLHAGDLVWSFNIELQVFEMKPVEWASMTRRNAALVRLYFDDARHLDATSDHQVLRADNSWARVGELRLGDFLLGCPSLRHAISPACAAETSASRRPNCSMLRPKMALRASRRLATFSKRVLLGEMIGQSGLNRGLASTTQQRGKSLHDFNRSMPVYAPFPGNANLIFLGMHKPNRKDFLQPVKRFALVLTGTNDERRRAHPSTTASTTVPAEAAFSLKESGSPRQRKIIRIEHLPYRRDVWDIEVAENHTFIAASIVAHNCVADNTRRFGPERTKGLCGVLKDIIRQRTDWRHGAPSGPHPGHPDAGSPGVGIAEADKWASPAWGGHHHMSEERSLSLLDELDLTFGVVDHFEHGFGDAVEVFEELRRRLPTENSVHRVLIGLDEPPALMEKAA